MVDLGNLVNADLWVVINVPLDILHEGICNSEFWPIMFVKAATNLVQGLDDVHSTEGDPQPEGDVHGLV